MRFTVKSIIKKTLGCFGYTIHKTKSTNVSKSTNVYSPDGHSIFTPWLEYEFQKEYYKIRDNTVVSPDRCYIIDRFCCHCSHLQGDFVECGVYKGGTAYLIANAIKKSGVDKCLYLFDTFRGMPSTAFKERDGHQEGDFGEEDASLESVENYLADFPHVIIHAGIIPTTFENVETKQFSFVHIDVDLYQTALDCCRFFYNRLVSGAVMIFDDYGFTYYKNAEKRAVDEFFANKPETLISLPTGQCVVIKL